MAAVNTIETTMDTNVEVRSPLGRRFVTVWAGQTVSIVGSTVSAVGAAVYAYAETGSAVWLGLLAGFAALPAVLAAPAMTVVDRLPRRTMMLAGDSFAALGPTFALVLALTGRLEVWHLVAAAFVGELGTAFQSPAAQAAVPLLVPHDALDRANSLAQLGPALGIVVGPLVAAPLVAWWGITPVLLVDLASFLVAVVTLATVRFADNPRPADDAPTDGGWTPVLGWLRGPGRPFRTLIATGAVVNGTLALFNVAVLALATEIGGTGKAGLPVAVIGAALIGGSIVSGMRGVGDDRIGTFVIGLAGVAAGCLVVAARPNLAFVALGGAIAVCLVPAVNAASATLFHERVPADMQGRMFGLRSAVGGGLYPAASASAGVLIAHVGAPLMDGPLSGSLGRLIGSGPERGAALVVLVAGAVIAAIGVGLARSPIRAAFRADGQADHHG